MNAAHRFDLVINNRASGDETYTVGSTPYTLEAGKVDIWINGVLESQNTTPPNDQYSGPVTSVGFFIPSATAQQIYVDNFGVLEGAVVGSVIPEPGTAGLLLGAAGLLLGLRRFRR